MISRTTKTQLLVFVLITLVGVSYTGARYARLDRLVTDDEYVVTANFAESGGIFVGAEVTYRGVGVGQVSELELSEDGVFVDLSIDDDSAPIPDDVEAVVANKSAVGEQYVDLQPRRGPSPPYLEDGSEVTPADTRTPISTPRMLLNVDELVRSVDRESLRTVVDELGVAFRGTGDDLGRLIDTQTSFIETAEKRFGLTRRLLRDGRVVLRTQLDSADHIRGFTTDLRKLSDTLVRIDPQLRSVIDDGSVTARQLRSFVAENADSLSVLFSNLITTGEITVARLHGLEQVLVLYPYVVEGSWSVLSRDPATGMRDARFGIVLTSEPHVCMHGYQTTEQRPPQDLREVPMNTAAHCADDKQAQTTARGAQHHPPPLDHPALNRAPVVATYNTRTGEVEPATGGGWDAPVASADAGQLFGEESWKWLLMAPLGGST